MNIILEQTAQPANLAVFLAEHPIEDMPGEITEAFNKLDADVAEFNAAMHRASRETVKQAHRAEIQQAIQSGDPAAVKRVESSRDDLETKQLEADKIRAVIRGAKATWAASRLCPAVIAPLQLLITHIREHIDALEVNEKDQAEAWGVPFVPSETLRGAREALKRVQVDLEQARAGKLAAQSPWNLVGFAALKQ